jgi:hypothetical protein
LGTKIRKKIEECRMKDEEFSLNPSLCTLHASLFSQKLLAEQVNEVRQIAEHKQDALPTAQFATGEGDYPNQNATAHKHEPIHFCYLRNSHRHDTATNAYNEGDIEDVAANDVAESQAETALASRHNACGKFWQTGAASQDSGSYDALANVTLLCNKNSIIHQHTTANDQGCHTDKKQQQRPYQTSP